MPAKLPNRVLELLYDRAGEFALLDELAAAAGNDPSILDAALAELARRGHELERNPARGVRLVRPTVLDAHLIERDLPTRHIARHVVCFAEVNSTNDVAFASAAQGAEASGLVVTAECQRAGRGRLGRNWICPSGAGILASVLLGDGREQAAREPITIAAGLAVAEGIELAVGVPTQLEWPNDITVDRAKVAGVLVETRMARAAAQNGQPGRRRTVVGFGVNVTAAPALEATGRQAICLAEVTGRPQLERIEILRQVLIRVDHWIEQIRGDGADRLHEAWLGRCGMLNRRLTVRSEGRRVTGRVLDVSPLTGLVLLADSGEQLHLSAETSTVEYQSDIGSS
jgi:BirA family biotin operon repressor/biotin-[acetyl-CoA-carboxylase] ligase